MKWISSDDDGMPEPGKDILMHIPAKPDSEGRTVTSWCYAAEAEAEIARLREDLKNSEELVKFGIETEKRLATEARTAREEGRAEEREAILKYLSLESLHDVPPDYRDGFRAAIEAIEENLHRQRET